MPVEQLAPTAVAEFGHLLGRTDDVGEEDGRQHAIGLGRLPLAGLEVGEEPLDLCEERFRVALPRGEVVAGKLDEPRAANVLGEVASAPNVEPDQLRAVQNERRYPDRAEDAADVDVEVHTHVIAQVRPGSRSVEGARFERHPIVLSSCRD